MRFNKIIVSYLIQSIITLFIVTSMLIMLSTMFIGEKIMQQSVDTIAQLQFNIQMEDVVGMMTQLVGIRTSDKFYQNNRDFKDIKYDTIYMHENKKYFNRIIREEKIVNTAKQQIVMV